MNTTMSSEERLLLKSFLRCSRKYLEFGCGDSTVMAADLVATSVVSIDSSAAWIDKIAKTCAAKDTKIVPRLIHVDVGPVGDWGYPKDPNTSARWPNYYEEIWQEPDMAETDLFLVDGRFRVACFMNIALNCELGSVIMIHDFMSRARYHVIKQVAQQIAVSGELAVFRLARTDFRAVAKALLNQYRLNPA